MLGTGDYYALYKKPFGPSRDQPWGSGMRAQCPTGRDSRLE